MIIPEKPFVDLSVMIAAGFLQLPPVKGKLIFSQSSDKNIMQHLLDCSYGIYLKIQN